MKKAIILIITLALVFSAYTIQAAVLTVDQVNGPYYTIAQAAAEAVYGDTIFVNAGDYNEYSVDIYQGVAVVGESKSSVVINYGAPSIWGSIIEAYGDNYFSGLTFNGVRMSKTITCNGSGEYLVVRDCVFNGGTELLGGSFPIRTVIEKNVFKNFTYFGSNLEGAMTSDFLIYDNIFANGYLALYLYECSIGNFTIMNNTFVNLEQIAYFQANTTAENLTFINNIVLNVYSAPLDVVVANEAVSHNCWYLIGADPIGITLGTNRIASDPMIVDATANDFSLLPTSPCIGGGDPSHPYVTASGLQVRLIGAGFHIPDAVLGGSPTGEPTLSPAVAESMVTEVHDAYSGLPPFGKFTLSIGGSRLSRAADEYADGSISGDDFIHQVEQILKWNQGLLDRLLKDQSKRRPTIPPAIAGPMIDAAREVIAILQGFMDTYG